MAQLFATGHTIIGPDGVAIPVVGGVITVPESDAAKWIDAGFKRVPANHIAQATSDTLLAAFNTLLTELAAQGILATS